MHNREEIVKTLGLVALLKSFGLTMQTIKYMALIAEHDSNNVESDLIFRRIVRWCEKPEAYEKMRRRVNSKLEVVGEDNE